MSAVQLARFWAWRLYHVDENSKATDIGLLLIRVMFSVCLFYHHGAEKFYDFHTLLTHPLNPIGIGVLPSVLFAGLSDGVCSLLVLFGFLSRYAAFIILICLNTVWWIIDHGMLRLLGKPVPPRLGAPPPASIPHVFHTMPNVMNVPMYIVGALVIFIAGPGRYSIDKLLETRMQRKRRAVIAA